MYQDLLDNLSLVKRWEGGRLTTLDLLLQYTFSVGLLQEDALMEALDAIFNDSRMVAVVNVLLPLHLRRGTGFWWQVLEMLMELTAPHQAGISGTQKGVALRLSTCSQPAQVKAAAADTSLCKQDLEHFDLLREALAHGVAQAVHLNCISLAEGVADPIDCMVHGFKGVPWEPVNVCHADRGDIPKRFPAMIADFYMSGVTSAETYCSIQRFCHIEDKIKSFLTLAYEQALGVAATMMDLGRQLGEYNPRPNQLEKGIGYILNKASMATAQVQPIRGRTSPKLTEAQQHSRLVGMCLLVFLQELQNNAARQATSPEERRQQLKLVQVAFAESCRPPREWHDFADIGQQLTENLLRGPEFSVAGTLEMASLYLGALVCLRAVPLSDCLDMLGPQGWPCRTYDLVRLLQAGVLWQLRLHLKDIAAGSAAPLRPSCPNLDPSVCFIDERGLAAAAGLMGGVAAQSPTQLQQQQSAPYDAATTAASQAAAALLQEEEKAAQATQQAKGRKAAKKARQKQRKQVNKESELMRAEPEQQENAALDSSKPTTRQATDAAAPRVVGGDSTNLCNNVTTSILATIAHTDDAQAAVMASRQEANAALGDSKPSQSPPCTFSNPGLLSLGHDSCLAVNGLAESKYASMSRAEEVLDSSPDCVVCWERCADVLFQPCGHLCTCSACAGTCLGSASLCPMCRCAVAGSINI